MLRGRIMSRPYRSVLYIPGNRARALEKARALPCDAIIFDLEDAVPPGEKANARGVLAAALAEGGYGARVRLVRINALDTPWGEADAAAVAAMGCDGVLLPKVSAVAEIERLAMLLQDVPLWAMMETPLGILRAGEIAGHPRIAGLVMGTNDLAKDLNSRPMPGRLALAHALGACVLAARAHGRVALDGVYNAFRDAEGLAEECRQGRDMGFDGKTLIHPDQIAAANAAFAPGAAEIELARRQIDAFEQAVAAGRGVAVLDDRIVENLHIVTARATLAKVEAISAMEMT
jgi:(3S)-malyl-CoA thioesterase